MESPVLHTERLTLRPFERGDIPALIPLIGAREVAATTLRIPHPYKEEHAEVLFTGPVDDTTIRFAITLREERILIGGTGMHLDKQQNHAELGYWIGVPYWGHGYATEAARAMVQYGFDALGLNRIQASHFGNNPQSGRVLSKIGMKQEGCLRQHYLKWGEYVDSEVYGILRAEYKP